MLGRWFGPVAGLLAVFSQASAQVFPEPPGAFRRPGAEHTSQIFLRAEFQGGGLDSVQTGFGTAIVAEQPRGLSYVVYGKDQSSIYLHGADGRTVLSSGEDGEMSTAVVILIGVVGAAALIALLNVEEEESECNLELIDLQELCSLQD